MGNVGNLDTCWAGWTAEIFLNSWGLGPGRDSSPTCWANGLPSNLGPPGPSEQEDTGHYQTWDSGVLEDKMRS